MSRSRRKTPIFSYCTTDDHEHWWKHAANRALRRAKLSGRNQVSRAESPETP